MRSEDDYLTHSRMLNSDEISQVNIPREKVTAFFNDKARSSNILDVRHQF